MSKRHQQSSTTKRPKERGGSQPSHHRVAARDDLTKFYGMHSCMSIFDVRRTDIKRIFLVEELRDQLRQVLAWADRKNVQTRVVPADEVSRVAGTEHHEGVCFEAKALRGMVPGEFTRMVKDLQRGVILVLEGVENPHNVGAILRTACFFGIDAVVLRSRVISSLSGAACRIAEGAAERIPLCIVPEYSNLFSVLKGYGYTLVGTSPHEARSLYGVKWNDKVVVMFGAEGTGLSPEALEAADIHVAIPRLGPIESLNVGASVSSVLTEVRREAFLKGHIRKSHGQPR